MIGGRRRPAGLPTSRRGLSAAADGAGHAALGAAKPACEPRPGQVKLVAAAVAAWTMVRLRRSKRPGRLLTVTDDFLPSTREGLATIQQRIADAHDQWADSIEGDVRVPDGPGGQDHGGFTWLGHAF